jgi:hypothetical protein
MKSRPRPLSGCIFVTIIVVLVGWFSACPTRAWAQGTPAQGQNAVYPASGVCCQGSAAFIDASMFPSTGRDFCAVLGWVLTHNYPAAGAVIDARGLPGNTQTSMTCSASPWAGIPNPVPPSTILLPATTGAAPIVIPGTWVLPNNTRLVGAGDALDDLTSGTVSVGTTLQACKSAINGCSFNPNDTDMIDMGTAPVCPVPFCNDVSVENLTLDGLGQSLNGIVNTNAQTGSRVDHVSLFQILGTGLSLSGNANNSGPYSNITFDTGSYVVLSSTVCASIRGLTNTHGIHGLTCISATNDADAAILLDSSNNSLKDIRIVGFYDGIRVGIPRPRGR